MLKKLVALFLLSWLPLQGIAAVDMPFCRHVLVGNAHHHAPSSSAQATHESIFDLTALPTRALREFTPQRPDPPPLA